MMVLHLHFQRAVVAVAAVAVPECCLLQIQSVHFQTEQRLPLVSHQKKIVVGVVQQQEYCQTVQVSEEERQMLIQTLVAESTVGQSRLQHQTQT
jgi:hypothetical protein